VYGAVDNSYRRHYRRISTAILNNQILCSVIDSSAQCRTAGGPAAAGLALVCMNVCFQRTPLYTAEFRGIDVPGRDRKVEIVYEAIYHCCDP
jgi:hypothetical protein